MTNKLTEAEKEDLRKFDKKFNIFLLIIFGLLFFYFGLSTNLSVNWFKQNGVKTTATVVDAYSKNRIAIYVVQFKVGESDITAELQSDLKVGQQVEILYDPDNPVDIRVAAISKTGFIFYVGALIFWLFAWLGFSELNQPPSN